MPTHDVLNERLSEYLDNELDAAGRARSRRIWRSAGNAAPTFRRSPLSSHAPGR